MFLKSIKAMFVVFMFLNSVFTGIQGRPLCMSGTVNTAAADGDNVDFFHWLGLGGIKSSGPSDGGAGHQFTNSNTLGGMKNSGPSSSGSGH
ncbi:hypothetical protein QN277_003282 [Acacia crassicarpa]|uniref:Uncharacterized protein n=1 Tax=Acacia crassicarpa TaxID=499986 RepID=A0AAE1MCA0_9FABA|nr:hypothetical protein QN277_003282 [Acacia crassicarpa]